MNIPIWSIQINEESNGHYIARCAGPLGHVIEYNGGEEFHDMIIDGMFGIESIYSGSHKAAFAIIISFNRLAKHEFHENYFGSWKVFGKNDILEYDGKNGWLEYTRNNERVRIMNWNDTVKLLDLKYGINSFNKL